MKRLLIILLVFILLLGQTSAISFAQTDNDRMARIDFTSGTPQLTNMRGLAPRNASETIIEEVGDTGLYGARLYAHNAGFKFFTDGLVNKKEPMAVSVEYYIDSAAAHPNTRICFRNESDQSHPAYAIRVQMMDFPQEIVNADRNLVTDKPALYTFVISDETAVSNLLSGELGFIFWKGTENDYAYVLSVTIFPASQLPAVDADYAFCDFVDQVPNPYNPQYTDELPSYDMKLNSWFEPVITEDGLSVSGGIVPFIITEKIFHKPDIAIRVQCKDAIDTISAEYVTTESGYDDGHNYVTRRSSVPWVIQENIATAVLHDADFRDGYFSLYIGNNLLQRIEIHYDLIKTWYEKDDAGFAYQVTEDGEVEIMGHVDPKGEMTVPEQIGDLPVTGIAANAFSGCALIKKIHIPVGVVRVGENAFAGCTGLTAVSVGNPPEGRTWGEALADCKDTLQNVTFLPGCTAVGDGEFAGFASLRRANFPDSLISIGEGAFEGCSSLSNLTLPASVEYIGHNAFLDTWQYQKEENWQEDALYLDGWLIGVKDEATVLQIPDGVRGFAQEVLANNRNLRHVILPQGFLKIEDGTFSGCVGLTHVTIPDSVKGIGVKAFAGCTSLRSMIVPGSVSVIGEEAFAGCTAMTGVSLPAGVERIGNLAFTGCPVVIYGEKDSAAHRYAEEWNIPFSTEVYSNSLQSNTAAVNGLGNVTFIFNITLVCIPVDLSLLPPGIVKKLMEGYENFAAFDISLKQDTLEVQPDGTVEVELDIPEGYIGSQCEVFRAEEDGTLTAMNARFVDGKLSFNTTHFSQYVVAERTSGFYGDADGDGIITSTDARLALQLAVGKIKEKDIAHIEAVDVDGDGNVTSTDARLILQFAVDKIKSWP